MADCTLKITNNSSAEISDVFGYVMLPDGATRLADFMEINNNTDLSMSVNIAPGETQYIHLVSEDITVESSDNEKMIRFNLGGTAFICEVG